MKHNSQITLLIAIMTAGFAGGPAMADEPKDKPKPKITTAERVRIQAVQARPTFSRLLKKGQSVTLYQLRQEVPTGYQYQVRIVNDDQKKQIEELVERFVKEYNEYQNKIAALEKVIRETTDRVKHAELLQEQEQLERKFKSRTLPTDTQSTEFYTISDVGFDYVGFERNGVETFHRLSSIHRILRGVEIAEE
jgi:hypothetical protein